MPINDELQQQLIKDLLIESAEGLDRFDREMLAFAGLPVVMGNASPALKLQAKTSVNSAPWRVTLSNDEGGVAVAIRKFALGE